MKDDLDLLDDGRVGSRNYAGILIRRRWYILAPVLLCGLIASMVAQVWHLLYHSEALILVEQQRVPEQYVTPNVITNLQTRLDAMTQQILSRTRLQRLIEDFKLYPRERAKQTMDEVIDKMRQNIKVELVQTTARQGDVTGFRISYSADSARMAQRITNELTSMFIDESLRQRTQQSSSTTEFLESQLKDAQKDLATQEQRLREYKTRFLGELPQQEQGNLQILSSLEAQLYATEGALQRAEQQKTYLETMKEEYRVLNAPSASEDESEETRKGALAKAEAALQDLQQQLSIAEARYAADTFGAARAFRADIIKELKTKIAEQTAKIASIAHPVASTPTTRINLAEVDSRLKAADIEIENEKQSVEELQKRIQEAQRHLSMTPVREQALAEITRNYENSKAQYQSLLQKKLQSELASNLEKRQQGEQFRILDPASLPEKPEGQLRILGLGWVIGLCLGFGLAAVREFTSPCVYEDNDLRMPTPVPVFRIPVIRARKEERMRKLRFAVEVLVLAVLVVAALGASAQTYLVS